MWGGPGESLGEEGNKALLKISQFSSEDGRYVLIDFQ